MNKFLNFLGLTKKAGKLLEGYNKCEAGIKENKVKLIILSDKLSNNSKDKFLFFSKKYHVDIILDIEMNALCKSIGLSEIGVLGITDARMSGELLKLWNNSIK